MRKTTLSTRVVGRVVCPDEQLPHCWMLPGDHGVIEAAWIVDNSVMVAVRGSTGIVREMWLQHILLHGAGEGLQPIADPEDALTEKPTPIMSQKVTGSYGPSDTRFDD